MGMDNIRNCKWERRIMVIEWSMSVIVMGMDDNSNGNGNGE